MKTSARILLAESDTNLSSVMQAYLRDKGYAVDVVETADEAAERLQHVADYTLCLLDMAMPRRRAYRVLELNQTLRKPVHVLALTAQSAIDELTALYEAGADDVMRKPIAMELVHCKIQVLLRRASNTAAARQVDFMLGTRRFDSVHQLLDDVHLSGRENDLLLMLCRSHSELVDRHVILRNLWEADNYYASRSLSVYINHLRRLLDGSGVRILSVHGKGYKLVNE